MIQVLIQLLVVLLVLCVVFWIVKLAAGQFGAPPIVVQIVGLILLLIFILYLVQAFGIAGSGIGPHWKWGSP
jgi:hypothetical protein